MQELTKIRKMPYKTVEQRKKVYEAILEDVDRHLGRHGYFITKYICHKLLIAMYGLKWYKALKNEVPYQLTEENFPEFTEVFQEYQTQCGQMATAHHSDRPKLLRDAIKLCEKEIKNQKTK